MNTEANTETEVKPAPFDYLKVGGLVSRRKKHMPDKKYARFNRRMLAATLDSLILLVLTPLFNRWFPIRMDVLENYAPNGTDPNQAVQQLAQGLANPEFFTSWLANMSAQMAAFCIFSAICWHFWSATPGKMLLLLKIVDAETEKPIADRQILIRIFGYIISAVFLFLGFFWISFDKRRQGWHDKMANTVVVVVPWKEYFGRLFRRG